MLTLNRFSNKTIVRFYIPFDTPICSIKIKHIYIINNYQTFVKCLTIVFFTYFLHQLTSIYRFLVVLTALFIFNYVFLKKYGAEIFLVTKVFLKVKSPLKQGGLRTFLRCEMLDGLHDEIGDPGTDERADGNTFE